MLTINDKNENDGGDMRKDKKLILFIRMGTTVRNVCVFQLII